MTSFLVMKEQAALQKSEAMQLMRRMFGIREGESNGIVERIVDCIIGAAILETTIIMTEAITNGKT